MKNESFTAKSAAAVSIGLDDLDRLISAGSGAAALLYLYCLRAGGPVTAEEASAALGFTRNETAAAAERLRAAGLLCGKPDSERGGAEKKASGPVPLSSDSTPACGPTLFSICSIRIEVKTVSRERSSVMVTGPS